MCQSSSAMRYAASITFCQRAKAKLLAETMCENVESVDLRDCIALSYKEMEKCLYYKLDI